MTREKFYKIYVDEDGRQKPRTLEDNYFKFRDNKINNSLKKIISKVKTLNNEKFIYNKDLVDYLLDNIYKNIRHYMFFLNFFDVKWSKHNDFLLHDVVNFSQLDFRKSSSEYSILECFEKDYNTIVDNNGVKLLILINHLLENFSYYRFNSINNNKDKIKDETGLNIDSLRKYFNHKKKFVFGYTEYSCLVIFKYFTSKRIRNLLTCDSIYNINKKTKKQIPKFFINYSHNSQVPEWLKDKIIKSDTDKYLDGNYRFETERIYLKIKLNEGFMKTKFKSYNNSYWYLKDKNNQEFSLIGNGSDLNDRIKRVANDDYELFLVCDFHKNLNLFYSQCILMFIEAIEYNPNMKTCDMYEVYEL